MNRAPILVMAAILPLPLFPGETGDFDGDGRLSIADLIHFQERLPLPSGSLQGFLEDECYKSMSECPEDFFTPWADIYVPSSVYLESLRRGVQGSLPHWRNVWPDPNLSVEPLARSDLVKVELLPMRAPGGDDHFVEVKFRLIALEPVRAFSLALESGGLLRSMQLDQSRSATPWHHVAWDGGRLFGYDGYAAFSNGVYLGSSPQTFLVTGGKWVVEYNLPSARPPFLDAGTHDLSLRARLPKALKAGAHSVTVHPASEVVLASRKLISPMPVNESTIVVEREVTGGWDEGIPPLQLDPSRKRVLGRIELRLTDSSGDPGTPGSPVAQAFPGDEFKVRVQMRTEVPLSFFGFTIRWYDLDLQCAADKLPVTPLNLFRNPEDGMLYEPGSIYASNFQCGVGSWGQTEATYSLAGAMSHGAGKNNYPFRPLEYFKPLNEWTDLLEIPLKLDPLAEGGKEILLNFSFWPYFAPRFEPYSASKWCGCDVYHEQWSYEEVAFENRSVLVLGDQEPPLVPDFGVRMRVGDAVVAGSPGDLVEAPLFARTRKPVGVLRLAMEMDPREIFATAFEINAFTSRGWTERAMISRGDSFIGVGAAACAGRPGCSVLAPHAVSFFSTDEAFALIEIQQSVAYQPYLDARDVELGKLIFEARDASLGSRATIGPGKVEAGPDILESGGIGAVEPDLGKFGPAAEFIPGTIRFVGFLRGDTTGDGSLNLTDAIAPLSFLFLGDEEAIACQDGADADDNGRLQITDAVLLLGVLFLGAGELPAPHPVCGFDLTRDDLGCRTTGCR